MVKCIKLAISILQYKGRSFRVCTTSPSLTLLKNSKQHYLHNPSFFQDDHKGLGLGCPSAFKVTSSLLRRVTKSEFSAVKFTSAWLSKSQIFLGGPWRIGLWTSKGRVREDVTECITLHSHLTRVLVTLIPAGSILHHVCSVRVKPEILYETQTGSWKSSIPKDHGLVWRIPFPGLDPYPNF